ncbi:MAG: hypothetical protein NTZ78_14805 [Candidatus Aureabacteria bacterium]|nr:hypothetical protein [Candidatus Auribacterota bacterium]
MKKWMTAVLGVMFAVGMSGLAVAGSIDSSGAPSGGSGMYTLQNLYDYLTSGAALTVQSGFQEPTSGPGSMMKTTREIGDDVKSLFDQCDIIAADVKSGKKFFCMVTGSWGIQTGALVVPPTPTPTMTPTPTATSTPTFACGTTFTDSRDNKEYPTVLISGQCWIAKNLDYNNGGCLGKNMTDESASACSYYPGGPYGSEGLLYQWNALAGACPSGWHIPTDAEWCTLETALKDSGQSCDCNRNDVNDCASAGDKLRVGGTTGFEWPLSGIWQVTGGYGWRGTYGTQWMGTQGGEGAYDRILSSASGVDRNARTLMRGYSARCVKN